MCFIQYELIKHLFIQSYIYQSFQLNCMRKQSEQYENIEEQIEHYYDQGPPLEEFQGQIEAIEGVELIVPDQQNIIDTLSVDDIQVKFYGIVRVRQTIFRGCVRKESNKKIIQRIMHEAKVMNFSATHHEAIVTLSQLIQQKNNQQENFISCIVENGGIPVFVGLLRSKKQEYISMAIKSIGVICKKKAEYLKEILQVGGMQALINLLNQTQIKAIVEEIYLMIGYLCSESDNQNQDYMYLKKYIPLFIQILIEQASKQSESILQLLGVIHKFSFNHMCEMEIYFTQEFIFQLLRNIKKDGKQVLYSLGILHSYASLGQEYADKLISLGVIKCLASARMKQYSVGLSQLYRLFTALACSKKNIQSIIHQKKIMKRLVLKLKDSHNRSLYKVLSQFAIRGDSKLIFDLFHQHSIMTILAQQLTNQSQIPQQFYELLYYVIRISDQNKIEGFNIFLDQFSERAGFDCLQQLQMSQSEIIFNWARIILDTFAK